MLYVWIEGRAFNIKCDELHKFSVINVEILSISVYFYIPFYHTSKNINTRLYIAMTLF